MQFKVFDGKLKRAEIANSTIIKIAIDKKQNGIQYQLLSLKIRFESLCE